MTSRSGPFWDAINGRGPMPRAAGTLGFELIDADVEKGTIEIAFRATADFTNPTGNVLEASLLDPDGTLIATATATARVIALDQARSAV
jgi:hypothetical protein